ncbi:MAG: hypothetical protein ACNS61_17020, partial [Candidatus Wenzhouxiangella sp. M2_3B_020]
EMQVIVENDVADTLNSEAARYLLKDIQRFEFFPGISHPAPSRAGHQGQEDRVVSGEMTTIARHEASVRSGRPGDMRKRPYSGSESHLVCCR